MKRFGGLFSALLLLLGVGLAQCYTIARNEEVSGTIRGRLSAQGASFADAKVFLHVSDGRQLETFVDHSGYFIFTNVTHGVHLLQPFHKTILFPEVRVEVGKRGQIMRSTLSLNRQVVLRPPFILHSLTELSYYEKRKPFDLKGFIMSPYGLMISFSLFAIFIFPMLKVDPEEYRSMQDQLRGTTSSSTRTIKKD